MIQTASELDTKILDVAPQTSSKLEIPFPAEEQSRTKEYLKHLELEFISLGSLSPEQKEVCHKRFLPLNYINLTTCSLGSVATFPVAHKK